MKIVICLLLCASSALAQPIIGIGVDTLRFGAVSAGGCHQRDFRLSNAGDSYLIISQLDFPDSAFELVSPALPDTITAGQRHSYYINFCPVLETSYNGRLVLHSNDPSSPLDTVTFMARGIRAFAGGEIIWSYQGIENVVSVSPMNDVNSDGFPDVVAESFDAGASGDNLLCISGSGQGTGQLIWSARPLGGPSNSGGYGDQCLITIDDLNRNGTQDVVLGTAWGSRSVFGIEGRTGQTVWTYDSYQHLPSGWVYGVASMGDLDGDSIPEVLAGFGSDGNKGVCLNGANGVSYWTKAIGDVVYSVCRLDDVNGDSVSDAVMGAGDTEDRVYCLSGALSDSGATVWSYRTGGSVQSVDRIADINNDGINDVIAGIWGNGDRVMILSGHPDSTVFTHAIWSVPVGQPIMRALACPDLNGDGLEDVLVASWANYSLALSGADGSEFWRNNAGDDVWAIYPSYDITGDSIPEVIAGSFTGNAILINGATGETIWSTHTNAKIMTVRPIPDINGDSIPDIIAGQQMLSGVGGKVYLISGGSQNQNPIFDDGNPSLPRDYLTLTNYPNPFNSETIISYDLLTPSRVTLEIYNIMGQRLLVLVDEQQEAGPHRLVWNGHDAASREVSSGLYFARITAGKNQISRKITLLR